MQAFYLSLHLSIDLAIYSHTYLLTFLAIGLPILSNTHPSAHLRLPPSLSLSLAIYLRIRLSAHLVIMMPAWLTYRAVCR